MKTISFSVPSLPLQILLLAALSLFLVSCLGEGVGTQTDLSAAVPEDTTVAASNKKAQAPAEEFIAPIAITGGYDELVKALFYVDDDLHTQLVDTLSNSTDRKTVLASTNDAFEDHYLA